MIVRSSASLQPEVLWPARSSGTCGSVSRRRCSANRTAATSPRVRLLRSVFTEAGFPTLISAHIEDWLIAHAAFVVPIAFALYRVGVDPARLAADPVSMRLMVLATRQSFAALRASGNDEIPTNLRILYSLPTRVVTGYWRRVLNSPRGELWFGAHSRAAPEEMRNLADQLQAALRHTGHPTPDLTRLLARSP